MRTGFEPLRLSENLFFGHDSLKSACKTVPQDLHLFEDINLTIAMQIDEKLRTEKITPELIDYIVEKIVREIQPEKIILYGSYARGDFHEDSDVDLF